jgi:hypothetical protein
MRNLSNLYSRQEFKFLIVIFITFIVFGACSKKINQTVNGEPHGLWITYVDSAKSVLTKGKFKNGIPVGKWIYNTPQGTLDRLEVYRGTKIGIRHYYPNGRLALKGKALIVNESKKLHFYYIGKWKYYTENGKPEKTAWFEKGKLTREEYALKSKIRSHDSLALELRAIDRDYIKYRDTLLNTEKTFGRKSAEYLNVKRLYEHNDSLVLLRLDRIIRRFGYPCKEKVGESNNVVFFIISNANWPVKEKYLEVFKLAASKGDISVKDLAFFEDKLWVAKEGWQLYGTQFRYTEDSKVIYYPVKGLSEMNDRRIKAGLEVVNLLNYPEKK